jgi:hypothetical protein
MPAGRANQDFEVQMSDFNIRSDSVDVEQIMKQIRMRIQEKRGVDYTEQQVRELATVRLEKFLDPKNLRSDLLEQFRKTRPPLPDLEHDPALSELPKEPALPEAPYTFDAETLYRSHRGPLRFMRRLLAPILKLFFNPNTLIQVLHAQSVFNLDMLKRDLRRRYEFEQGLHELRVRSAAFERSRAEWNLLYYEVLHNLVLETTRNGIEVKNLRMRVEALASRLDFSERRVRALEGVVQYRPEAVRSRPPQGQGRPDRSDGRDRPRDRRDETPAGGSPDAPAIAEVVTQGAGAPAAAPGQAPSGEAGSRRRRRRRRGRRGSSLPGGPAGPVDQAADQNDTDAATGDVDFEGGDELVTAVDDNNGEWAQADTGSERTDDQPPPERARLATDGSSPQPAPSGRANNGDGGAHQDTPPGWTPDPDKQ